MPAYLELQNIQTSSVRTELSVMVEHLFAERPGDWKVTIAASRAAEDWELRIEGPKEFERSFTLIASAGQHEPEAVRALLVRLLPTPT